ncbi:MAG TPA: hypothetical protein GX747_02365 [Tenericutes bacterium]|nr:hypothetical protein [Mycoplasmatota bacterium]
MNSLNILDRIPEKIQSIKEWFYANHSNPFMWLGIIAVCLAIFKITYNYLHKD